MSLLTLAPLMISLCCCLGAYLYILKRKSLAQAICIQQAAKMQTDLKKPLIQLLRMNAQATSLRAQRESADQALDEALASGIPYTIAVAEAAQTAVILAQLAFRAQQWALLAEAENMRFQGQRELRSRVRTLSSTPAQSLTFYFRPLAVEPKPAESLSPNYETISLFETGQQQRFRFQVDLLGNFPISDFGLLKSQATKQVTECSVTLQEGDDEWKIRILAAKASWN